MFGLERILVPVDFSDSSFAALRQAAGLARRFHSEVSLLHVNELPVFHSLNGPLGFGIPAGEAAHIEHMAHLHKHLDEFGAAQLEGVITHRILCCGDPARVIVDRAKHEQAGLIVIPTHGHGVFRGSLLGSVTAKVLHDAPCPVWTGPHFEEVPSPPREIHHVMCCVNFGLESQDIVRWGAAFATRVGATITVVHAVVDHPPNLSERCMFQWGEESREGGRERLRKLLLEMNVEADVDVVGGADISKALCAAADNTGAGLMVVARHGLGDAVRKLGSHTYSIACGAPCPVVSV